MAKYRGVNLGGWLALERWITPGLFKDTEALDEYGLWTDLTDPQKKITKHYQSFITKKDLRLIKKLGLNSIRVPIGYWIFGDYPPFIKSIKYLDWIIGEAKKLDLEVIIDLHGAPGSQNGLDHSGRLGEINWSKDPNNIYKTLSIIDQICQRYQKASNILGIELLNEPSSKTSQKLLIDFYNDGYQIIRKYFDINTAVIIHDTFKPYDWIDKMVDKNYQNLILDTHLYQCFSDRDKDLDIIGHLQKTTTEWVELIEDLGQSHQLIIGEWSLGLDSRSLEGLDDYQKELAVNTYRATQLLVFERALGHFFWTYRTEGGIKGWDLLSSFPFGLK